MVRVRVRVRSRIRVKVRVRVSVGVWVKVWVRGMIKVKVEASSVLYEHLNLLEVRAVPAVGLGDAASLPVLVESDGPQRDEDAEEDSSSVVEEDSCLHATQEVAFNGRGGVGG